MVFSERHFRILNLFLCTFCLLSTKFVSAERCSGPRTPHELRNFLWGEGSNYTRRTRPDVALLAENPDSNPADARPENVRLQLHILSMKEIDELRSEFQLAVWFRQRWNDYRLRYSTRSEGGCFPDAARQGFDESDFEEIWKPDITAENMVSLPTRIAGSFWIYPNGDVVHASSLQLRLSCKFDFSSFPHDEQECDVVVGTWKEDASEVVLSFYKNADPVTLAASSDMGNAISGSIEWDIIEVGGEEAPDFARDATQSESVIVFKLTMKRKSEFYIDFVLVPASLIVSLSWISFFLDRKAAPARVAMSIICFLTIVNFLSSQLQRLPRLDGDNVCLLKILTMSMLFTFYAVVEYVICNYLLRVQNRIAIAKKEYLEAHGKKLRSVKTEDSTEQQEQPLGNKYGPTKSDMKESGYDYKLDLLLMKKNGEMIFADEDVEIFSRWVYPIAYGAAFLTLWFGHT